MKRNIKPKPITEQQRRPEDYKNWKELREQARPGTIITNEWNLIIRMFVKQEMVQPGETLTSRTMVEYLDQYYGFTEEDLNDNTND